MCPTEEREYSTLKKTITELLTFDCSKYSNSFLKRRIKVRLKICKLDSYEKYAALLHASTKERAKLKKELTVHTTIFFRDAMMWHTFKDKVIPSLVRGKKEVSSRRIAIWSAGCSTGEEALTIAICLQEALMDHLNDFIIAIHGTDLDQETVDHARKALYKKHQFEYMPPRYLTKYFDRVNEDFYVPKPILLNMITYEQGDILNSTARPSWDVIFCRNTIIYLDRTIKAKVYEEFYNILKPGGFFMMGKTETLQGPAVELFTTFDSAEKIYQKT